MKLSDFPRPPQDTRIGIHWSPGISDAIGISVIRHQWIPLLKEMGITWVKLLHPGGLAFAEDLLASGIMPIVRLFRPRPNSSDPERGTLGPDEIAALEAFVHVGVRYFEFNNEPDSGFEWADSMPADETEAQRIVARNAIRDMETILSKGGLPGIPAVSPGKKWDLLGAIVAEGGKDLLAEGVWWALHNYDFNHPVAYPSDPVNQQGVLLTEEAYHALGPSAWQGPHWGERTLEFVNQHRKNGANPGATAVDDPSCWRGYEYFAHLALQHLGYHIPLLSTENGPLVGQDDDPRYPTITPELHRDIIIEQCRIMMGTSRQAEQAPDYYFCTAYWILGSSVLGASGPWEEHAWFSPHWDGGKLPVVDALRALPKRTWQPKHDAVAPPETSGSRIWGVVRDGVGHRMSLRSANYQDETVVAEDETYRFEGVPAGIYRLAVADSDAVFIGLDVDGIHAIRVNFDLTEEVPRASEVSGRVVGGAGLEVRLHGPESRQATLGADETFHFDHLPPGDYTLIVSGTGLLESIVLDGHNHVRLTLKASRPANTGTPPAAPAWTFVVKDEGPGPGFGVLRCQVQDKSGLRVRVWADGWSGATRLTGSKPELGPDVCEFAPLNDGTYHVEPEGLDVRAKVTLKDKHIIRVHFHPVDAIPPEPQPPAPPAPVAESVIEGEVVNGAGEEIRLKGPVERTMTADQKGRFRFGSLPAGSYTVEVGHTGIREEGIHVDGQHQATVRLVLPPPRESRILGKVVHGAGVRVRLKGPNVNLVHKVGKDERFRFEQLPPGEYTLRVVGADVVQEGIVLDGHNEVEVTLDASPQNPSPTAPTWGYTIEDGGPGPGFGVIRCDVEGLAGVSVHLWADGWPGVVQQTGSKPEYGPFACEFAPLGSGKYYLEPEGLGVRAHLNVDGHRVVWVHFYRRASTPSRATTDTPKVYEIYLWPTRKPSSRPEFDALLRYMVRFRPEVGADIEKAVRARHVLVLGKELPRRQTRRLQEAGVHLVVIDKRWDTVLTDLLTRGQPVP